MKKRLKIMKVTAIILAVTFCTLLGCEKKEAGELLLPLEEAGESGEQQAGEEGGKSAGTAEGDYGMITPDGAALPAGQSTASATEAIWPDALSAGVPAQPEGESAPAKEAETEEAACVVHICGAVREPGVYVMEADARIYQAVDRAGGFDDGADENYLNQADLLSDGMKIYVPTKAEVEQSGGEIEWKISGETGVSGTGSADAENGKQKNTPGGSVLLININTAGEAELCTLPGVGSNKAKSIIAYREKNGAYRTIEDIMNVEGIKDGVFQKIKDSITV